MHFKPFSWLVIIITFIAVVWVLFSFEIWASEWKDLFAYLDRWEMWVGLLVAAYVLKKIVSWVLVTEIRLLK
jgi:hypothetical protein